MAKFSPGCNLPLISWFLLWLLAAAPAPGPGQTPRDYAEARAAMVAGQLKARDINDGRVLAAMGKVPRHLFLPPDLAPLAYGDHPLPIGGGQTISQPYIVALMTSLLSLEGNETVLEIGTGSGYQAAVLGDLAKNVHTIERHAPLAQRANQILTTLGYTNIFCHTGDGTQGWPEAAPYQGILVTAAAPSPPQPLLDQLADGGKLVIPVGDHYAPLRATSRMRSNSAIESEYRASRRSTSPRR